MIHSVLERLCALSDHRIRALCAFIVRHDAWWQRPNGACERHVKLRKRFASGVNDLPFTPRPVLTEQQVLARDFRGEKAREPRIV